MKKLRIPNWDPMDDFDMIVQNKDSSRRTRLQALRSVVESSYHSYASILQRPRPTSKLASDDKQTFVHCYETRTVGLDTLKRRLDELNDVTTCPYCDINTATTFDHHLPKHDFPEFSICAYNLVRACHSCQNDERDTKKWCNDHGKRLLLHPYYDPIDEQGPLFVAKIDVSESLPRVDYVLNEILGREVGWFSQLSAHWKELDLPRRYGRAARQELTNAANLVKSWSGSPAAKQKGLKTYAEHERRSWGPNHWRVALYTAAADDAEFIRYALRAGNR